MGTTAATGSRITRGHAAGDHAAGDHATDHGATDHGAADHDAADQSAADHGKGRPQGRCPGQGVGRSDGHGAGRVAPEHLAELAVSVSRLMHVFGRARAHMLDRARYDVEWTAQLVISALVTHGPMRAGALAEIMHSDPSTISRQVASLVREGMIERRADPEDGRASVLVATPTARAAHEYHLDTRVEHFRTMLADWDDQDCQRFAELLERFTDDFDTYKNTLPDGPWPRSGTREEQS